MSIYGPLLDFGCFFTFLIFYTVGRTLWTRDQSPARPLPTKRTAKTHKKTHTDTLASSGTGAQRSSGGRKKALDRMATVIGVVFTCSREMFRILKKKINSRDSNMKIIRSSANNDQNSSVLIFLCYVNSPSDNER
jgi:hypothetical protein